MTSISAAEFACLWKKTVPRTSRRIGVAFSGGPDSLGLLVLLNRHISQYEPGLSLVSITVNHLLQASSTQTTRYCQTLSESLGVENISVKIPWGMAPFPPLPAKDSPFEQLARESRYHLLLDVMRKRQLDTLVMGHHADDQVETLLMRMLRQGMDGKGPAEIQSKNGWAGMRNFRRWGMGFGRGEGSLGWAGADGMTKWVARPLLDISKDRLLATCKEHKLRFVEDVTNFQPEVTLRNAIRATLEQGDQCPTINSQSIERVKNLAVELSGPHIAHAPGASSRSLLRSWILNLQTEAKITDEEVTRLLDRYSMVPAPSTLILFSPEILKSHPNMSTATRHSVVLRILRYVSPHPWGQPSAEAGRRFNRIEAISDRLFNSDRDSIFQHGSFTHGANVLWSPVLLTGYGSIKLAIPSTGIKPNDQIGWMASRAASRRTKPNGPSLLDPTVISQNLDWQAGKHEQRDILWDNRFIVTIRPWLIPDETKGALTKDPLNCRITVTGIGRWMLPRVSIKRGTETLAFVDASLYDDATWAKFRFIRELTPI